MAELFVGEITPVAFGFAPRGTALCNGQLLAINQNQALFSLLGTTYGGDGITNFALPDLRGRTIVHSGAPGYTLGATGGVESVTLSVGQIAAHSHAPGCNNGTGNSAEPASNVWAVSATGENLYQTGINPTGSMANGVIGLTGGGQGHSNIQPYLVINFIIALQGVFPTRN